MISISTDKNLLDFSYICRFLSSSYWACNRTEEQIKTSIENSTCYGVYLNEKQIGFARIVSDKVVFSYLMDLFIDEKHEGKGFGQELMRFILNDPEFQEVQIWYLRTRDAHKLYEKFGFTSLNKPFMSMELDNRPF